jgi:anthranilate phosphoribosyltransferase
VFHPDLVGIHVRVLAAAGCHHVLVVYGLDGMDEVSLGAATMVGELKDGKILEYEIHPEDFGLHMNPTAGSRSRTRGVEGDAAGGIVRHRRHAARDHRAERRDGALHGGRLRLDCRRHPARTHAIASGAAKRKLEQFVALTQKLAPKPAGST